MTTLFSTDVFDWGRPISLQKSLRLMKPDQRKPACCAMARMASKLMPYGDLLPKALCVRNERLGETIANCEETRELRAG